MAVSIAAKQDTIDLGQHDLEFTLSEIVRVVNEHYRNVADFARQFDTGDLYLTAQKIYDWVKHNIRYKRDDYGKEQIRTPERTLSDRAGDCEDLSILIASLLKALGYKPFFYVVSFGNGWQHIFVGVQDIILDAVHDTFNQFPPGITDSFIVSLSGVIPPQAKEQMQGIDVQVLEGPDIWNDLGSLIVDYDDDLNPIFDEDDIDDAEAYVDALSGISGLEDLGRLRLRLFHRRNRPKPNKPVGRRYRKSHKVGNYIKRYGFAPTRAAYLAFLKLDLFHQAAKLYLGLMPWSKAQKTGISHDMYNRIRSVIANLEKRWQKAGGNVQSLRKAIIHGGKSKVQKTFGISGLGSTTTKAKMFWRYVEKELRKKGVSYAKLKRYIHKQKRHSSASKLAKVRAAFLYLLRKNFKKISAVLWLTYLPKDKVVNAIGSANYDRLVAVRTKLEQLWKAKGGNVQDLRNAIKQGGQNKLGLGVVQAAAAGAAATTATAVVTASMPFWKKVIQWLGKLDWGQIVNKAQQTVKEINAQKPKNSGAAPSAIDTYKGGSQTQTSTTGSDNSKSDNTIMYVLLAFLALNFLK